MLMVIAIWAWHAVVSFLDGLMCHLHLHTEHVTFLQWSHLRVRKTLRYWISASLAILKAEESYLKNTDNSVTIYLSPSSFHVSMVLFVHTEQLLSLLPKEPCLSNSVAREHRSDIHSLPALWGLVASPLVFEEPLISSYKWLRRQIASAKNFIFCSKGANKTEELTTVQQREETVGGKKWSWSLEIRHS